MAEVGAGPPPIGVAVMPRAFAVLYLAAFIDATGIGLIIPILPTVLHRLCGASITLHYGALIACFALMQFLCAPALGVLSDRWGRRPILLLSLAGGAVDYLLTGYASALPVLYGARLLGGITAANISVITASIADLAPEADRPRRFGALNAAFGIGWIAGPALGGMLGQVSLPAPFLAAAALNGLNLVLALLLLPGRHPSAAAHTRVSAMSLNPFASLRAVGSLPALLPMLAMFAALNLLGQIPGSLWVLYGQARYGWSMATVGWSCAWFGLLFALVQATLTGPITGRLGERGSLRFGIGFDGVASVAMGAGSRGWVPFAAVSFYAMGNVGMPALQGAMSREMDATRQGQLQGVLASLTSLATVIGPVVATATFAATRGTMPGAVWFAAAAGYFACMIAAGRRLRAPRTA